jgi:hypothetical protein
MHKLRGYETTHRWTRSCAYHLALRVRMTANRLCSFLSCGLLLRLTGVHHWDMMRSWYNIKPLVVTLRWASCRLRHVRLSPLAITSVHPFRHSLAHTRGIHSIRRCCLVGMRQSPFSPLSRTQVELDPEKARGDGVGRPALFTNHRLPAGRLTPASLRAPVKLDPAGAT